MLSELASIVVPVYLCAGLGFLWVRTGRHYDTAFMTDIVMLVGAPCLTFSGLVRSGVDVEQLLEMSGTVLLATSTMAAAAAVVLTIARKPLHTFLAPMTFGNSGNMGIPICYFAFGEAGLALGLCFYATVAFLHFTVGQWMWSGKISFEQLIRTPLIYATVLSFAVVALELEVPTWLMRTTSLMGDLTIPLMQFSLGVSLARLGVGDVRRSLWLAVYKLAVGAAVGFGVAALLGLEGAVAGVVVLNCAMPVAVFNYLFAARYDRSPSEVAGVVVLSTLLSFVSLPIVLGILLGPG